MARATERYYNRARGKINQHIGYVQQGKFLPPSGFSGFSLKFDPLVDGVSFHVSAEYTGEHSAAKIDLTRGLQKYMTMC